LEKINEETRTKALDNIWQDRCYPQKVYEERENTFYLVGLCSPALFHFILFLYSVREASVSGSGLDLHLFQSCACNPL